MKTKILTILLLLIASATFALSPDTPAIEPTLAEQALQYLLMGLSILI